MFPPEPYVLEDWSEARGALRGDETFGTWVLVGGRSLGIGPCMRWKGPNLCL